jgi:hypothetical protein
MTSPHSPTFRSLFRRDDSSKRTVMIQRIDRSSKETFIFTYAYARWALLQFYLRETVAVTIIISSIKA